METELPESVGLSVARALRRYPEWHGVDPDEAPPVVTGLLGDQINNISIRVANSRTFVLRVNRARPEENALDPSAERAALSRAAQAGLAPALRFFDAEEGVTVCDFLKPDSHSAITPRQLGELLREIHALEPIPQQLSLVDRIRHYRSLLIARNHFDWAQVAAAAIGIAATLESRDRDRVLCHNDLLPSNCLISAGRLWAIDWEYAAMGSRWFDIAAASIGHGLSVSEEEVLIRAYLGRSQKDSEKELLTLARESYGAIERVWYALNPS